MSSIPDSGPDADVSLGRWCIAWQRLAEGFLSGIQHALNNRSAALSAISQVMSAGVPAGQGLEQALAYEVERLQTVVGYLGFLRQNRSGAAEPLDVRAAIVALTGIWPEHAEMNEVGFEVEGDPAVLPIVTDPGLLSRVLLASMVAAGRADPQGAQGAIRVRYGGDDVWVTVTVEPGNVADESPAERDAVLDLPSLAWPVAVLGAEILSTEADMARGRTTLRFPTLPEARRRERSG